MDNAKLSVRFSFDNNIFRNIGKFEEIIKLL